jgi:DNA-binding transcriptional ArsR family regulator
MTRDGIRTLTDREALRVVSDPLRLRILEMLRAEPRSVTQLASVLEVPRTRLYYHIGLLEQHDLITVAETRLVSGISEKVYRVTAYRLSVDRSLLGGEAAATPIDTFVSLVLDEAAAEIRRAIARGLIDLDLESDDVLPDHLSIGRQWFRFTDERLAQYAARLKELENEFWESRVFIHEDVPQPATGSYYEHLIAFYPIVPPETGRGE